MPLAKPQYATLADMQARYEASDLLQLTDQLDTGSINETTVNSAIADASAVITGYVARRHDNIELIADNHILNMICCQIAYRKLWRDTPPDSIQKAHDEALAELGKISKGIVVLDEGSEIAPPRPDAIHTDSAPKKMSRDSLGGY